jgi:hypothetical protein
MFVASAFFFQGVVDAVFPIIKKVDGQLQVIRLFEGM